MTPDIAHRRLVLRVNELFHDLEGEQYDHEHPEIFRDEIARWKRMLDAHFPHSGEATTVLDVGSGTGFVGQQVLPRLHTADRFICADISDAMLGISVRRASEIAPDISVQPLKMVDERLDIPDASVDVVVMNSVLHHIPDAQKLLEEMTRVLRPGGTLFIAHEPNNRFYRSWMFLQSRVLHHLTLKRIAAIILKQIGLYSRAVQTKEDPVLDQINQKLIAEKTISHALTRSELSALIDVHSPTAGGMRTDEGFDPQRLLNNHMFDIAALKTYRHFGKASDTHLWLMPYEWLLTMLFPFDGATFFLVAKKKEK